MTRRWDSRFRMRKAMTAKHSPPRRAVARKKGARRSRKAPLTRRVGGFETEKPLPSSRVGAPARRIEGALFGKLRTGPSIRGFAATQGEDGGGFCARRDGVGMAATGGEAGMRLRRTRETRPRRSDGLRVQHALAEELLHLEQAGREALRVGVGEELLQRRAVRLHPVGPEILAEYLARLVHHRGQERDHGR